MGDLFGGASAGGWLGLPEMATDQLADIDIAVMGIGAATPYELGAYCMDAPDAIRGARSWPGILYHHDFDLHGTTPSAGVLPAGVRAADLGNLAVVNSADAADTAANRKLIHEHISAVLTQDAVPFIFGGDDSIPIPVLQAYDQVQDITILQLDAHIDWRDDIAGERLGLSSNMRRASEMKHIGKIVQLGARGIGSARGSDVQDAIDYGVSFHTMQMLNEAGGIDRAIADLPAGKPIYIALDIDCLDPAIMPAVIGKAKGGMSYEQLLAIMIAAAKRGPIIGFNLVEFMPEEDINNLGAQMASRVALSMLGVIAQQRGGA